MNQHWQLWGRTWRGTELESFSKQTHLSWGQYDTAGRSDRRSDTEADWGKTVFIGGNRGVVSQQTHLSLGERQQVGQ